MTEEHSSAPAAPAGNSSTSPVPRPDTISPTATTAVGTSATLSSVPSAQAPTPTDATTTATVSSPHHDQPHTNDNGNDIDASLQTQGHTLTSSATPSDPSDPPHSLASVPPIDVTPFVVTSPPQESASATEVVPTAVNAIDIDALALGSQHHLDPSVLSLRPGEFSVLSPSARTSHTRVDLSAASPGEVSLFSLAFEDGMAC